MFHIIGSVLLYLYCTATFQLIQNVKRCDVNNIVMYYKLSIKYLGSIWYLSNENMRCGITVIKVNYT